MDVLDGIDKTRKYQRGTWSRYRGGVISSFRATDPLGDETVLEKAGWHVVLCGIDEVAIEAGVDLRSCGIALRMTDGSIVHKTMTMPVTIYRGIWRTEGFEATPGLFKAYERGDQTTRDGSQWTLMSAHENGAPGVEDSGWQLSTKKGRDGRDGLKGEKGERGAEGRAGQDLARLSPRGPN